MTQNVLFLHTFLASAIGSFLFLTFVSCHAGIFSSFPFFPLQPSHLVFSLLEAQEQICAPDCSDLMNSCLFLQCDLHDICEELLPVGFS